MELSMTEQEKDDLLIQVTAYTGFTVILANKPGVFFGRQISRI